MMRYQISASDNSVRQRAPNRITAEALYEGALPAVKEKPGVSLTLTDTKDNRILRSYARLTPEELIAQKERAIERFFKRQFEKEEVVKEFSELVVRASTTLDPTYPFRWANDVFEAAAHLRVARELWELRDKHLASWADVQQYAAEKMMGGAQHPEQSTSACSNLMSMLVTAAYAIAAEELRTILSWEDK